MFQQVSVVLKWKNHPNPHLMRERYAPAKENCFNGRNILRKYTPIKLKTETQYSIPVHN